MIFELDVFFYKDIFGLQGGQCRYIEYVLEYWIFDSGF